MDNESIVEQLRIANRLLAMILLSLQPSKSRYPFDTDIELAEARLEDALDLIRCCSKDIP